MRSYWQTAVDALASACVRDNPQSRLGASPRPATILTAIGVAPPRRIAAVLAGGTLAVLTSGMPAPAGASSLAICTTRNTTGIPSPWASRDQVQPDASIVWRVDGDVVTRVSGRPERRFEPTREGLRGLFFIDAGEGWVVGDAGTIAYTADAGAHWAAQVAGVDVDLAAITCVDRTRCWAVGGDHVLRTADAGRHWSSARVGEKGDHLQQVFFLDRHQGWVAGQRGALYATVDGGDSWSPLRQRLSDGAEPSFDAVRFGSSGIGWAGMGSHVARTEDGGRTWEETLTLPEGLRVFGLATTPDGRVYAATEGDCIAYDRDGTNYWSDDSGRSWHEVADPAESDRDWDAAVKESGEPEPLRRFVLTRRSWRGYEILDVVEALVGVEERSVTVAPRREGCGDTGIRSAGGARPGSVADRLAGVDLCSLDAPRANDVLRRFASKDADILTLSVECGLHWKTFRIPTVQRRPLRRASARLSALVELTDHLGIHSVPLLAAEPALVTELRDGVYDAVVPAPREWRALLDAYRGPLPLATSASVSFSAEPQLRGGTLPRYPDIAQQARVQGDVTLELILDPKTGGVVGVEVVQGVPLLEQASVEAARDWRFDPVLAAAPLRVVVTFGLETCADPNARAN